MTSLNNHEFEIVSKDDGVDGFVFGGDVNRVGVHEDGFDPGESVWLTQDTSNTRRGVQAFGRDVLGGKVWTWSSFVNKSDVYEAVAALDDFVDAWSPTHHVKNPGSLCAIRYRIANRDRRVFGRPRKIAFPTTNQILNGYNEVTHDFQLVDSFTYDDLETVVNLPFLSTSSGGGWTMPVTMPINTAPSTGFGGGQLTIGGSAPTYPVIRFYGPWTDPSADFGSFKIKWTGSVPNGGYIEIDTRPWKLTVLDQNGASQVGGLDRQTWLEDCYFSSKTQPQVTLGGTSASGTAYCRVSYRNAWKSI